MSSIKKNAAYTVIIGLPIIALCTWLVLKSDKHSSDRTISENSSERQSVKESTPPSAITAAVDHLDTKTAATDTTQLHENTKTSAGTPDKLDSTQQASLPSDQPNRKADVQNIPDHRAVIDPKALRPFGKSAPFKIDDLPDGELKKNLLALNAEHQTKAIKWLHTFTFNGIDAVDCLRADNTGGIFYVCAGTHEQNQVDDHSHSSSATESANPPAPMGDTSNQPSEPVTASAAVPISSPPIYNSKPGSTNHIYLDFNGGVVPNTTSWGNTTWNCYAYSLDTDYDNFSDAEQTAIRRIYERIAEDYAPFDVNVTTDKAYDPDTYTGNKNYVGWVLITKAQDKNSVNTPAQSGGRAYLGVFGQSNYASLYQPAWVTYDNLSGGKESSVAEAASHEMGHNMGLSHDTQSNEGYYGGHGAGDISWAPIMGSSYTRNVTQWSKGEYYDSKHASWNGTSYDNNLNTNDDLAIIAARVSYRADDHGDSNGGATELTSAGDGSFSETGIIETTSEVDVFSFATGAGSITLNANPYKAEANTYGGNLDILMELYDSGGSFITSNNSASVTTTSISTTLSAGTYYVHIKPTGAGNSSGTGSPYDSTTGTRAGYTVYGSLGQYTLSGNIILPGVSITETGGTNVTEGGATDTYSISLGTAPSSSVTVNITPNSQVTTNKSSVVFITGNWATPQTVTVTAVDDSLEEGSHTGIITHTSSSSDSAFNGIGVGSVIVNITDNDNIVLTSPNGGENWIAGSTQNITWTSLKGGNVKIDLLKNGVLNSTIISSTPNDGMHSWIIPNQQLAASNYKIRITSVDTPSTLSTSTASFTVSAMPGVLFSQNFDAASTMPMDWSNSSSGTTWSIVSSSSHTPTRSAYVPGVATIASAALTSEAIAVPTGYTDLQFSFYHSYNLENNWDAGVLEFSIDGGAWFDVTSGSSGAAFASSPYNLANVPSNYGNPLGGRAAWSGNSGGYVRTLVNLTNTTKYAGKSLRARWIIGCDNTTAVGGWNVDTLSLLGTSPIANYLVTYNANGSNSGSVPTDLNTYSETEFATVLGNTGSLVKTGYTFAGWNTLANRTGTHYYPASTYVIGSSNVTLYAHWSITPFYTWAGGGSLFTDDTNNDGLSDGLAWLLGAANSSANVKNILPVSSNSSGNLILNFNCLNAANRGGAVVSLQYSNDLGASDLWTNHTITVPETSTTVSGVTFTITPNGNLNQIQATVPSSQAGSSGKLFSRISGTTP